MIIYKAENKVNGKIYIGQTIHTLEYRKKQHENSVKYKNSYAFAKAIKKYGKENFLWEIIDTAKNIEELNEKESYYILKYHSLITENGYNLKGGGENSFLTQEVKDKIGNAQKGELNHMYGKTGKLNSCSKRVKNITLNKIYDSATICASEENISLSHICAVCRGDRGSVNNNIYRYLDKNGKVIEPKNKVLPKSKPVKNIETGEIFNTATEAEIKYKGKKTGNVNKACKNPNSTYASYHWIFIDNN